MTGYKCFNNNLTNRYGMPFEIGKIYKINGEIRFGNNGNGFHFCKNMEDTLRYFDAMNNTVSICSVIGSGQICTYFDDYYGYYDMFASSQIEILKELTREEIIITALNLNVFRVQRFLSLFKLYKEEIELFKQRYYNEESVYSVIEYYQENKFDAFVKRRK